MPREPELSGSLPESKGIEPQAPGEEPLIDEGEPTPPTDEKAPEDAPESEPGPGRPLTNVELAAVAGVTVERNPDDSYTLKGADFPETGLVAEADKVRDILLGAADGTWRDTPLED